MSGFEFCFTAGKVGWQALRTRSMENDLWIFLAILLGLTAVVLPTMAFYYRCRACGSLAHGFKSYKLANLETGEALLVCRRCGDRTAKGKVESDGSVTWFSGGAGHFDKSGHYTGDAGGVFGDGGGSVGGGGGDGGGGG